jgi:segregation and condensation protein A
VLDTFHQMEENELHKEKRGNIMRELKSLAAAVNVEAELQDVDLYKLMQVLEKVMKRYDEEKNRPVHQVVQYPFTVEGQKEYILNELTRKRMLSFAEVLEQNRTRVAMVFNFLAILEMHAVGKLTIQIGEGYNNFWITLQETESVESPTESSPN